MHVATPDRRGPVLIALAGTVAAIAAFVAFALTGGGAEAAKANPRIGTQAGSLPTPSQVAFRDAMRKLWEDHITWTRMVIVDIAAGLPDLPFAERRLLRNQVDIGDAIKPYYGQPAGAALTRLLRTHILEAVPVVVDAKAGNKTKLEKALTAWYANANRIAAFLTKANPTNWPLPMTRQMMKRHLDLTTKEAVARLERRWNADIAAYDAVHREILAMADMLSTGIIRQFPERFS
jgi:hypothetical protein